MDGSNNNPVITVFSFVYNMPEKYVRRAVESVLNQTFPFFIYILIDNASTDGIGAILEEYAAADSRIRFVKLSRNTMLPMEEGDYACFQNSFKELSESYFNLKYVCLLDADDYYEPDFLELAFQAAEEHNADIVICDSDIPNEVNDCVDQVTFHFAPGVYADKAIADFVCSNRQVIYTYWGRLFKTEIVNKYFRAPCPVELCSMRDAHLNIAAFTDADIVCSIGKTLHHWLDRGGSESKHMPLAYFPAKRRLVLDAAAQNFLRTKNAVTEENVKTFQDVLAGGIRYDLDMAVHTPHEGKLAELFDLFETLFTNSALWNAIDHLEAHDYYVYNLANCVRLIQKEAEEADLQEVKGSFVYALAKVWNDTNNFNALPSRENVKTFVAAVFDKRNVLRIGKRQLGLLFGLFGAPYCGGLDLLPDKLFTDGQDFLEALLKKDGPAILEKMLAAGIPPQVSVYTVAYNTPAHYMRRAVESILNQTFPFFEYVLVNNACTDKTGAILEEYAAKDKRIRLVINTENTFNSDDETYIEDCFRKQRELFNYKYVCNLDSDDYYEKTFLEVTYAQAEQHKADIVVCDYLIHPEENPTATARRGGTRAVAKTKEAIADSVLNMYAVFRMIWCKLYRTELFNRYWRFYPDIKMAYDTYQTFLRVKDCGTLVAVGRSLCHYTVRRQSESMALNKNSNMVKKHVMLYELEKDVLKEMGVLNEERLEYLEEIFRSLCVSEDTALMYRTAGQNPAEVMAALELMVTDPTVWRIYGGFKEYRKDCDSIMNVARAMTRQSGDVEAVRLSFLCPLAEIAEKTKGFNFPPSVAEVRRYLNAVFDERNINRFGQTQFEELFEAYGAPYAKYIALAPEQHLTGGSGLLDAALSKDAATVMEKLLEIVSEHKTGPLADGLTRLISLKAETVGLDSDFIRHNPRETSVLYHTPGKAEITVFAFVYNTPEEMLRRAVESVLSQTYTNFEFVVVDNACTDDSPRVLAEYAAKDSRVRVITFPENTNFSYNDTYINERYEYLKTLFNGEYICNIDSDDYYDQDFLEEMYCLAKEHTADMVICGSYWKPENDRESVQSYGYPYAVCADDEAIAVFLRENTPAFSTVWGRLTKAAIFKECFRHVPEVGSGLDTYVGILSAGRCGVIVSSGKILCHHLLRKSSYANVIERRHKVISRNLPIRDALAEFFRLKNAVSDLTAAFTDSITRGGVASYDMDMLENAKDSSPLVVFEALEYLFSSELLWRVFGGYEKGLEYFEKALGLARHIQANNNELPEIKNGFLYHIAKVFNDTKDFERIGRNEVKTFINAVFDLRNPNRFGRYYLERLFRGYDAPFWGCLSHVQDRYYQDKREFVNAILQKDSVMVLENLLAAMFESGGDSLSREVVRRIGGHEGIKQLDEDFIRHFRHETSLIYHGAYKQAYRCLENKLKHASENNGLEQILTALLRAAALCEKVEWFIDVRLKRLKFYMSAGRVDDAVDEYLALEDVCGDKKLLCKLKAELYVLCGDPGNAAATVAEALAAFPGDVEFAEALQTLGLGVTAHMRT